MQLEDRDAPPGDWDHKAGSSLMGEASLAGLAGNSCKQEVVPSMAHRSFEAASVCTQLDRGRNSQQEALEADTDDTLAQQLQGCREQAC